ncbi:MAG: MFS transporter, partial [Proteobacteria bacterium]|nr:MFS transporter [Pseudomonadota bacterium]
IGARVPAVVGVLAMAVALFLLSQQAALWHFYALSFVYGVLGHSATSVPLYANVGYWFTRNKGLAMGAMAAGGAMGQGVVPFVARLLISEFDWQTAYMFLAAGYVAIGLPVAALIRDPPMRLAARAGQDTDETGIPLAPREVIAWISVAVIFCCTCMSVPIVHVVSLVSDRGFGPEQAASVLLVLMVAGTLGRVLGGKLADMVGALQAYMLMSFCQTVLVVWFPFVYGLPGTYALAAVFGIAYSGVMAGLLICLRVMVPARLAGRAMGIGGLFGWFGMGFGGFQGGFLFDLTGTYTWSFSAAAVAGVINLTILTAFYLRIQRRRAMLAAV